MNPFGHEAQGDHSPEVTAITRAVLKEWAGALFAGFVLVLFTYLWESVQ